MYYIIIIILILLIFYFKTKIENIEKLEGDQNVDSIVNLLMLQNIKVDPSNNILFKNNNTNSTSTIKFENGNLRINNNITYDPSGNLKFGDYTYDPSGNISNRNITGKLRVENNFIKLNDDISYDNTGVLRFKDYVYDSLGQKQLRTLTTYSNTPIASNSSNPGNPSNTVDDKIYDEIQIIKYAADNNDNNPLKLAHAWFLGDGFVNLPYTAFDSITPINMYIKDSQNNETLYLPRPNEFMCYSDGCKVNTSSVSGKNNLDNGYTIKFKTPTKMSLITLYNNYMGRRGILNTRVICKRGGVVLANKIITKDTGTLEEFYTDPTTQPTNISASSQKPEYNLTL